MQRLNLYPNRLFCQQWNDLDQHLSSFFDVQQRTSYWGFVLHTRTVWIASPSSLPSYLSQHLKELDMFETPPSSMYERSQPVHGVHVVKCSYKVIISFTFLVTSSERER